MTLLFKGYQSPLPTEDGKKLWYPRLVKFGKTITAKDLGKEISEKSSLTRGDVGNVIDNLITIMGRYLMDGRSVQLDGLGTFTAIIRSRGNGVETWDEVNDSQINGINIRFSPTYTQNGVNGTTRALFEGVNFERIDKKKSLIGNGNGNGGNGGDDDDDGWEDPNA